MSALPRHVSCTRLPEVRWLRSSYSTGANNCVETARPSAGLWAGLVAVRDSKDPAGPALLFSPVSWTRFADRIDRL
ncbi:DUF397 domain-containing protein [Streptomyces fumanus]|uniref:DUF397 domain-containing protein n=1 Tax=Streptomyces fumanus TaxID=67302 RepID=UPI0033E22447